jgi:hypothetical protein
LYWTDELIPITNPVKITMTAITVSISTSVKPPRREFRDFCFMRFIELRLPCSMRWTD